MSDKKENEFVASYKTSCQISQDDWRVFNRSMKLTEKTTIGELLQWYREDDKRGNLDVFVSQTQKANN